MQPLVVLERDLKSSRFLDCLIYWIFKQDTVPPPIWSQDLGYYICIWNIFWIIRLRFLNVSYGNFLVEESGSLLGWNIFVWVFTVISWQSSNMSCWEVTWLRISLPNILATWYTVAGFIVDESRSHFVLKHICPVSFLPVKKSFGWRGYVSEIYWQLVKLDLLFHYSVKLSVHCVLITPCSGCLGLSNSTTIFQIILLIIEHSIEFCFAKITALISFCWTMDELCD